MVSELSGLNKRVVAVGFIIDVLDMWWKYVNIRYLKVVLDTYANSISCGGAEGTSEI